MKGEVTLETLPLFHNCCHFLSFGQESLEVDVVINYHCFHLVRVYVVFKGRIEKREHWYLHICLTLTPGVMYLRSAHDVCIGRKEGWLDGVSR